MLCGNHKTCKSIKLTFLTQCGMVWVLGERWWVLMTITVMMIEAMTNTMVNSMYLPIRGTALEVEGINSTMTRRNTVRDSKTEMLRVIFSPAMPKHKTKLIIIKNHCCSYNSELSLSIWEVQMWMMATHTHAFSCTWNAICTPSTQSGNAAGQTRLPHTAPGPAVQWKSPDMTRLRYRWWVWKVCLPGALYELWDLNDEMHAPD